uniref:NR LBD domain-containing protein n=1 Tax=Eptatretus burgeri TaxID=7764 RepID=A0A8C4PZV5_EPTBU
MDRSHNRSCCRRQSACSSPVCGRGVILWELLRTDILGSGSLGLERARRTPRVDLRAPHLASRAAAGVLLKTVRFVRTLPSFTALPKSDRHRLVADAWVPLLALGLAQDRVGLEVCEAPSLLRQLLTQTECGNESDGGAKAGSDSVGKTVVPREDHEGRGAGKGTELEVVGVAKRRRRESLGRWSGGGSQRDCPTLGYGRSSNTKYCGGDWKVLLQRRPDREDRLSPDGEIVHGRDDHHGREAEGCSDSEGLQELRNFLERCWSLDISPKEYAYLKGIVLFNPDVSGLRTNATVTSLQLEAQQALLEVVEAQAGGFSRFPRLLLVLHVLRAVPVLSLAQLFFRPVLGDHRMELLVQDLMESH